MWNWNFKKYFQSIGNFDSFVWKIGKLELFYMLVGPVIKIQGGPFIRSMGLKMKKKEHFDFRYI